MDDNSATLNVVLETTLKAEFMFGTTIAFLIVLLYKIVRWCMKRHERPREATRHIFMSDRQNHSLPLPQTSLTITDVGTNQHPQVRHNVVENPQTDIVVETVEPAIPMPRWL